MRGVSCPLTAPPCSSGAWDSSTSLWVIRRDGWKHFTLPARAVFLPRSRLLRRALGDLAASQGRSAVRAQAALDQMFAAPAASMLKHTSDVIVAQDDVLALVPFEALLTAEIAAFVALAGPGHVIALTGAEASRERLLGTPELHEAEVIHVATHGDVNEAERDLSGSWLAPDSGVRPPAASRSATSAG